MNLYYKRTASPSPLLAAPKSKEGGLKGRAVHFLPDHKPHQRVRGSSPATEQPLNVPSPRSLAPNAPIAILGVPFDNVTTSETIALIERMIASRQPHYLVTANVDFIVQAREDVELRRILFDAHLVLCDGTPLLWASRWLGNPLPERVAGSDLVPLLIEVAARNKYRLFLLGATPDSASHAVSKLQAQYPELIIAGHYSPPFNKLLDMDHDEIKRRISAAKPDLLFVSFGCPKQEKWIAMHYRALGVPVVAGVGATIDFLAGHVKRAPLWMQKCGAEWIFRVAQEPRRLFRRYLKDLGVFGSSILAQWWQLQFRRPRRNADFQSAVSPICNRHRNDPPLAQIESLSWQLLRVPKRLDLAAVNSDSIFTAQLATEPRHCLLEMAGVKFIDSTGVGALIHLQKRLHADGRQLVLVAPSPFVQRALILMRLQDFFASAPDLGAAQRLIQARASEQLVAATSATGTAANPLLWHGEITAANAEKVWQRIRAHLLSTPSPLEERAGERRQNPSSLNAPCQELIIDLSAVRFIDSTGLALMIRTKKMAQRNGANVLFTHPQPAVRNVLHLARLEQFLLGRPD